MPAIRHPPYFAGLNQLAVHPGDCAKHLQRLFPISQQAVQEFQRLLRLPRCQQIRQFPNRRGLLGNHQRGHIRSRNNFLVRRIRCQLVDLRFQTHQVRRHEFCQIFRRAFLELDSLFLPNHARERHCRCLSFPGIVAKPAFHNERLLREHLAQFHALIQRGRFHHQHCEWRRVVQVRTELCHSLVPVFFSKLFDRFRVFEENHLLRRKHRHRLRLLQRRLRLSSLRRIPRHCPRPRCFRHESFDQLFPAGIAQIDFFAQ